MNFNTYTYCPVYDDLRQYLFNHACLYNNNCMHFSDADQFIFSFNKCGHRNVLSKRQVWMSIFHIINLKKNISWTQGSWIFF
jgi:hypothetical protein